MNETIKDYVRFKIIEYKCPTCGHYWFRKGQEQGKNE